MGKLLLLINFLILTPFVLVFTLALYTYLSHVNTQRLVHAQPISTIAYTEEQPLQSQVLGASDENDQRAEKLRLFFIQYKSLLEPFAENFVRSADQYSIDYRLLPAIAMQESNLCKKAPIDSYNCWGFGIYGGNVKRFGSFSEAIDTVSGTLAKEYKNKGFETPEEIAAKYTPSDNGKWVNSVTHFMEAIDRL